MPLKHRSLQNIVLLSITKGNSVYVVYMSLVSSVQRQIPKYPGCGDRARHGEIMIIDYLQETAFW
jgi:hypothetical protein